jgi:hypothetical protein
VQLLDQLLPMPACITTPAFDLVAWNCAYSTVNPDPSKFPGHLCNVLWGFFMSDELRNRRENWREAASDIVARFRATYARNADDTRFNEVVAALIDASADFRSYWEAQVVSGYPLDPHVVNHPDAGRITFKTERLELSGRPGLNLFLAVVANADSRARVDRLVADAVARGEPMVVKHA